MFVYQRLSPIESHEKPAFPCGFLGFSKKIDLFPWFSHGVPMGFPMLPGALGSTRATQQVSLFIDGQRATEPIQLPEEMKGKTCRGSRRGEEVIRI